MNRKGYLIGSLLIIAFHVFSQKTEAQPAERLTSRIEYIERYKDDAIREMLLSGVPASITLAQGMLESDNGNSPLARYANNHFGIKCHNEWDGPTFIQDDDAKNECFRKYYSVYNSFKDHSEFLSKRSRYASLFKLKTRDYKGWAKGLRRAGYATNPKYATLLIKLIEENKLTKFDRVKKMPKKAYRDDRIRDYRISKDSRVVVMVHENRIKYTLARNGDTFESIAKRHTMKEWQILKYNEFPKTYGLKAGEIVYLQPKRRKANNVKEHIVQEGDTFLGISQKYGVKMKCMKRYNKLEDPRVIKVGQTIYLRKPKRR